mmetsp:Transcript_28215/g.64200  ORF Transcript_28215/g.64200 Transcript_28215/m.64200 type:complete len:174 (-) Transcript_28215:15-536(-)
MWGAINGLCSKGYMQTDSDIRYDYDCRGEPRRVEHAEVQLLLLRRRKYIQLLPRTEHVFVPSDEDRQVKRTLTRFQYACLIINHGGKIDEIVAPPEFSSDEAVRGDPFGMAVIQKVPPCWVESNGFVESELHSKFNKKREDIILHLVDQEIEGYNIPTGWGIVEFIEREIRAM